MGLLDAAGHIISRAVETAFKTYAGACIPKPNGDEAYRKSNFEKPKRLGWDRSVSLINMEEETELPDCSQNQKEPSVGRRECESLD